MVSQLFFLYLNNDITNYKKKTTLISQYLFNTSEHRQNIKASTK